MKLLASLALICLTVAAFAQDVTVGSKKFTESFVLGEIARGLLAKAGITATHKEGMGGTIILWQALKQGSITVYPEYTGTIGEEILKSKDKLTDDQMRDALQKEGIGMTPQLGFNNTYALVMKKDLAQKLGITKISDLKNHEDLVAGPTLEFLGRKDGWEPLSKAYGFNLKNVKGVEHMLGYKAMNAGSIAIKDAYSTDAAIAENNLVVLDDDLGFFPQYKAVYLYRLSLPKAGVDALSSIAGKIDETKMTLLNARAEKTKDYVEAANVFLKEQSAAVKDSDRKTSGDELGALTAQHLTYLGISMLFAIVLGVPLGIWASRRGLASAGILGATGLIQTVPSLALLAILVPYLGTGTLTVVLALTLYSLLPIVQNTATGLQTIAPSLRESAAALGLSPMARLTKVELPLALPTILAGIRTAAVINVGLTTIAAFIGAGGLGQLIQTGLALSDNDRILRGGFAAAALAVLVLLFFEVLGRLIVPRGLRLPESR